MEATLFRGGELVNLVVYRQHGLSWLVVDDRFFATELEARTWLRQAWPHCRIA